MKRVTKKSKVSWYNRYPDISGILIAMTLQLKGPKFRPCLSFPHSTCLLLPVIKVNILHSPFLRCRECINLTQKGKGAQTINFKEWISETGGFLRIHAGFREIMSPFHQKISPWFWSSLGRQPLLEEEDNCLWDIKINILSTYTKITLPTRYIDLENLC